MKTDILTRTAISLFGYPLPLNFDPFDNQFYKELKEAFDVFKKVIFIASDDSIELDVYRRELIRFINSSHASVSFENVKIYLKKINITIKNIENFKEQPQMLFKHFIKLDSEQIINRHWLNLLEISKNLTLETYLSSMLRTNDVSLHKDNFPKIINWISQYYEFFINITMNRIARIKNPFLIVFMGQYKNNKSLLESVKNFLINADNQGDVNKDLAKSVGIVAHLFELCGEIDIYEDSLVFTIALLERAVEVNYLLHVKERSCVRAEIEFLKRKLKLDNKIAVKEFTNNELNKYRIHFRDGKLYYSSNQAVDTANFCVKGRVGFGLFVFVNGKLYIYSEADTNNNHKEAIQHISASRCCLVGMAGTVAVSKGTFRLFIENSGHYLPDITNAKNFIQFLHNNKVNGFVYLEFDSKRNNIYNLSDTSLCSILQQRLEQKSKSNLARMAASIYDDSLFLFNTYQITNGETIESHSDLDNILLNFSSNPETRQALFILGSWFNYYKPQLLNALNKEQNNGKFKLFIAEMNRTYKTNLILAFFVCNLPNKTDDLFNIIEEIEKNTDENLKEYLSHLNNVIEQFIKPKSKSIFSHHSSDNGAKKFVNESVVLINQLCKDYKLYFIQQ